LAKLDAVKVVTVRGERRFTEGAPVDVVEELSGKFAARQLAVVINRGRGEMRLWSRLFWSQLIMQHPSRVLPGTLDLAR